MKSNQNFGLPIPVSNYLKKYGLSDWSISFKPQKRFNNVIVIPVLAEYGNLHSLLESLLQNDKKYFENTLALFVINNLKSSDEEIVNDNQLAITFFKNIIEGKESEQSVRKAAGSGLDICFVDASSKGLELPDKDGGVGLARKIGMDLALTVFDYQSNQKKIIICLDADCTVDHNYLTTIIDTFNHRNLKAGYVEYEHALPDNEKQKEAIVCYEIFLRYYVTGLKYANSPYAFPTIGSTMVCDYESYIQVGGMNKRKAAEDFYFMEKLAKVTSIHEINNTTVHPSSRGSWRVPFGTGQRVNRFLSQNRDEYLLYDPKSFVILKKWNNIFLSKENKTADYYLKRAEEIYPSLKTFLEMNLFAEHWRKIIESSKSSVQIQKQKILWFDGFKTLKLIHFLRDQSFPEINMFDALDEMFRVSGYKFLVNRTETIPNLDVQMKYLEALISM
ncbi:MAG: glycosyltransferase family A protein [Bacteroidota bacterium]